MTIEKMKYRCSKCYKTLTIKELKKVKTITINKTTHRYIFICPVCCNNKFGISIVKITK